jgi:hypothetical protein
MLRVGNSHLSYQGFRLPWTQRAVELFALTTSNAERAAAVDGSQGRRRTSHADHFGNREASVILKQAG